MEISKNNLSYFVLYMVYLLTYPLLRSYVTEEKGFLYGDEQDKGLKGSLDPLMSFARLFETSCRL